MERWRFPASFSFLTPLHLPHMCARTHTPTTGGLLNKVVSILLWHYSNTLTSSLLIKNQQEAVWYCVLGEGNHRISLSGCSALIVASSPQMGNLLCVDAAYESPSRDNWNPEKERLTFHKSKYSHRQLFMDETVISTPSQYHQSLMWTTDLGIKSKLFTVFKLP